MVNQLSIFTAASATHVASIDGHQIQSFSFGRPPRDWAARACCMSYKKIRSPLTNPWLSSGLNLREPKQFYVDLIRPGTLARKTFTSPYGLHAVSAMNNPAIRAQPIVSFGGIGSAAALAKFYSMLANGGELDGQHFFSPETLHWMK